MRCPNPWVRHEPGEHQGYAQTVLFCRSDTECVSKQAAILRKVHAVGTAAHHFSLALLIGILDPFFGFFSWVSWTFNENISCILQRVFEISSYGSITFEIGFDSLR